MALEPLYTLKVAAELIPWRNPDALRKWLQRHPEFPARYQPRTRTCWLRMLTESECLRIREMVVKTGNYREIRRGSHAGTPASTRP